MTRMTAADQRALTGAVAALRRLAQQLEVA
jgi:hypothetical protein